MTSDLRSGGLNYHVTQFRAKKGKRRIEEVEVVKKRDASADWSVEETDRGTRVLRHRGTGVAVELHDATKNPTATQAKAGNPNTKVSTIASGLWMGGFTLEEYSADYPDRVKF